MAGPGDAERKPAERAATVAAAPWSLAGWAGNNGPYSTVRTCVSGGQGNLVQVGLWLNGGEWAGNVGLGPTRFVLRRFGGAAGSDALKAGMSKHNCEVHPGGGGRGENKVHPLALSVECAKVR